MWTSYPACTARPMGAWGNILSGRSNGLGFSNTTPTRTPSSPWIQWDQLFSSPSPLSLADFRVGSGGQKAQGVSWGFQGVVFGEPDRDAPTEAQRVEYKESVSLGQRGYRNWARVHVW